MSGHTLEDYARTVKRITPGTAAADHLSRFEGGNFRKYFRDNPDVLLSEEEISFPSGVHGNTENAFRSRLYGAAYDDLLQLYRKAVSHERDMSSLVRSLKEEDAVDGSLIDLLQAFARDAADIKNEVKGVASSSSGRDVLRLGGSRVSVKKEKR